MGSRRRACYGRQMRTHARSKRALAVLGATAVATLICWTLIGSAAALAAFLGFLTVGTIATIPGDLEPGEYDLFGFGILAAALAVGLVAMAFERKPNARYTADMDICGDRGCADER